MSLRKVVCLGLLVLAACGGDDAPDAAADLAELGDAAIARDSAAQEFEGDASFATADAGPAHDSDAAPRAPDAGQAVHACDRDANGNRLSRGDVGYTCVDATYDGGLIVFDDGDAAPAPCKGTYYPDVDGDGFGDTSAPVVACVTPAGHVSEPGDCYDLNAQAHPGSAAFGYADRGDGSFDFNCDGKEELGATGLSACAPDPNRAGWVAAVPGCGGHGMWHGVDPNVGSGDTCGNNIGRVQACF